MRRAVAAARVAAGQEAVVPPAAPRGQQGPARQAPPIPARPQAVRSPPPLQAPAPEARWYPRIAHQQRAPLRTAGHPVLRAIQPGLQPASTIRPTIAA